jgi:1-acyl-sn-glycerol-3-phosphate acyltransferase
MPWPAAGASVMRVSGLPPRDVEWIDRTVPLLWPALKAWFRPEVRGLDRIPEEGPVVLVGNHSGGNVAPDTLVFTAAFIRRFGARRAFYQLAHELVVAAPWLALLRRCGMITASPENARAALRAGAAVLVYPGGDWEAHRPAWQGHRIDFHGRHGFVRLALETGVPLVPVVAIGG